MASAKQNPDPKLVYEYNYDDRNRMVRKKLPGAEEVFMVYDKLDRIVLYTGWKFKKRQFMDYVKYDKLRRQVVSGMYKDPASRENLQNILNNHNVNSENRNGTEYTNNAFPMQNCTPYLITYYDDYNFLRIKNLII